MLLIMLALCAIVVGLTYMTLMAVFDTGSDCVITVLGVVMGLGISGFIVSLGLLLLLRGL